MAIIRSALGTCVLPRTLLCATHNTHHYLVVDYRAARLDSTAAMQDAAYIIICLETRSSQILRDARTCDSLRSISDCSLRDYLNPATDKRIEIIDHRKYLVQFIHFNPFAIIFLLLSSAILL